MLPTAAFIDTETGSDRLRPAPSYTSPITFHYEIRNHTSRMQKLTKAFKVYRLMVLTLICVAAGLTVGLLSRPFTTNWTDRQFMYIEMPGELYLRLLKLIIIPLLVSNVILSFGIMKGKLSSYLGRIAGFLYFSTNFLAISIAIVLVLFINPGKRLSIDYREADSQNNIISIEDAQRHSGIKIIPNLRTTDESQMKYPLHRHLTGSPVATVHPIMMNRSANNSSILLKVNSSKPIRHDKVDGEVSHFNYSHKPILNEDAPLNIVQFQLYQSNISLISESHHFGRNTKLPIDVLLDVLRNLVPDSLIGATLQQTRTRLFAPKELLISLNGTTDPPPSHWPLGLETVGHANIIGLLAISVLFGVVLSHMDEASKPILDLCFCIAELSLRIGLMVINVTPFCIMFLLIGQVARTHDLGLVAGDLFMYSVTVLIALFLHGFILLPTIYYLITKKSPLDFLWNLLEALVASFATSSSNATMAIMLNCLTKLDLNPVVVGAFGPLGSVFNMNGTAIYEAVGVIFIAQTLGVNLPITSLLLVGLSSAVASFSTCGVPSSGLVSMVIVLNAINLPVLQLSLLYFVDFAIDRFRTVVNVWSGAIVCALIDHLCPKHLFENDETKTGKYCQIIRYRERRATLANATEAEDKSRPRVISITITPPLENSYM